MANKEEVLSAIAIKTAAVTAKLEELKALVAAGAATAADLDEIITAVNNIPEA